MEDVSFSPIGFDGVVFALSDRELGAYPADVRKDDVRCAGIVVPPGLGDEHVLGDDAVAVPHQAFEDGELNLGKLDRASVAPTGPRNGVQFDSACGDAAFLGVQEAAVEGVDVRL